jgi:hypothetical protein
MKQLFLTLALVLLPAIAGAERVDSDEALQIAERFFAQQSSSAESSSVHRAAKADAISVAYTSFQKSGEVALYVINRGGDSGFVLVSADGDTDHPVLGWSDNGAFDYDKAPVQLKEMLEAYSHPNKNRETDAEFSADGLVELSDGRMAYQIDDGQYQRMIGIPIKSMKRSSQRRIETVPNIVVQPLVKVRWTQGGWYSLYIDPYYEASGDKVAGCVPTAMAQIMKYWEFPARGRGFHMHNFVDAPADIDLAQLVISGQEDEVERILAQYARQYNVNYGESVYKWKEMGGAYPTTEAEAENVSKLIFDCHSLCEPAKLPKNRGTGCSLGSAASAMVRYFGYDSDMQYIECKGNEDKMCQELDEGRPILMEGFPSRGALNDDGHAFVCDGYAEDGYFHFNFGWGGDGDGFYLLSKVNPVTSDFSMNQYAFIGIQPSLAAVEKDQTFINVTSEGVGVVVGGYGDLIVPATVEVDGKTYPVMKVDSHTSSVPTSNFDTWFKQYINEFITRVTLPESVTEIGAGAFFSPYLTEVNLPANIRKIGANAFPNIYKRIKKVTIPSIEAWLNIDFEPNTLEDGFKQYMSNPIWSSDNKSETRLYIGDEEATNIFIPASIKEVRPYAFCGYQFLNSVYMEEGVEKIGASAFERVPLTDFNIPSTIKEIGAKAFYDHQASIVSIPANLIRVGSEALMGDKIAEYIVDEKNPKYSTYQGILYDKSRRTLVHCPNYHPGFQYDKERDAVGVPSSVTTIRAHSFGNKLRKLTLPPSVRNIEDEAFVYTYNLRDLYLYTQEPLPVTWSMFHLNAYKMNVHVPIGAGEAYRSAAVWKDMNIVEDQAAGSLPPEHYDYVSDYNAIQITDYMPADGFSYMPQYYLFDSHPVITYSGTSMLITSATSRYLFEKDHYQEMYFTHYDDPDGIDDTKTSEAGVVFRTVGNRLIINGLDAHTQVLLYNVEGQQLVSARASAQGHASISIPTADIVVVKAGNYSFKIHTKK